MFFSSMSQSGIRKDNLEIEDKFHMQSVARLTHTVHCSLKPLSACANQSSYFCNEVKLGDDVVLCQFGFIQQKGKFPDVPF